MGFSSIALDESSPEKAGVGGSIPSLATTFQSTYFQPHLFGLQLVAPIATSFTVRSGRPRRTP